MFTKSLKVTDFTGHHIYVGIDVHFKSWQVSIYSEEFELKTFSQPPNVEQLTTYLTRQYPRAHFHLAYEAGFCGFWIQRAFEKKGFTCMVVHPADIPGSDKESKRKTDRVDSRKIARGLKNRELNTIFVPDECQEADRQLLRSRSRVVEDMTMVKNRIKSFLKFKGILIPPSYKEGKWSQAFIKWLSSITLSESNKVALQTYLDELRFLQQKGKQLQEVIKDLSCSGCYRSNMKLLTSIPSIGIMAAMTLLTEIGDIGRFKKLEHLCSYCGLAPDCHNSGATERIGAMSRRGNAIIKTILIECSWMAIRKDPALLLYYKQLLPRMNANKAIVKVARKLLNRIRFVLVQQKEYVLGIVA